MNRLISAFIAFFICINCINSQSSSPVKFTFTCFQNNDKTWGYDILRDGKTFIHQTIIPAIQGLKGFSNKHDAEAAAKFAIGRMQINPNEFPTITIQDLRQLKILN